MGFVLSFAVYDLKMFSEPRQDIRDVGLVERRERDLSAVALGEGGSTSLDILRQIGNRILRPPIFGCYLYCQVVHVIPRPSSRLAPRHKLG